MKKIFTACFLLSISLPSSLFAVDNLYVSGITGVHSTANGTYVFDGVDGTLPTPLNTWKFVNGSNTYYICRDGETYWDICTIKANPLGSYIYFSEELNSSSPLGLNWHSASDPTNIAVGVSVVSSQPEIGVLGNATTITDGSTSLSFSNYTKFGSINYTSGTVTRTFTINNTGLTPLTISGVAITGTNADDYTVMTAPASTVAASSQTTFSVKFNDDENPYTFSIQGTGLAATTFTNGSGFTQSLIPNSADQVLGRFQLTADVSGATLTAVSIQLNNPRTGLSNLKLWSSMDAAFGGDAQIGSIVAADGASVSFSSLASSISTSGGTYYFLTGDVAASPTGTVQGEIVQNSSLTLSNGTLTGTISNAVLSSNSAPLPVELTSFTGASNENGIVLYWTTATEINNYGFDVERKGIADGRSAASDWTKVGFVAGNGSSNTAHQYSYSDAHVSSGTYAYRLKLIDRDGTSKYSTETEATIFIPKVFGLNQNYPNPFNPTTTISFTLAQDGYTTLKIYSVLGKEVATLVSGEMKAGVYHTVAFDGSAFSSGVYFSRLASCGNSQIKKLVLMR